MKRLPLLIAGVGAGSAALAALIAFTGNPAEPGGESASSARDVKDRRAEGGAGPVLASPQIAEANGKSVAGNKAKPAIPGPKWLQSEPGSSGSSGMGGQNAFADAQAQKFAADVRKAPTREELTIRAAAVENYANRELERLVPLLGLTEDQQDRVFASLAQHSPAFHPALSIVSGESPVSELPEDGDVVGSGQPNGDAGLEESIYDSLTPEQKVAYEEEVIDRIAWWEDVVGHLVSEDEVIQIAAASTAPEGANPTDATTGAEVPADAVAAPAGNSPFAPKPTLQALPGVE